MKKILEELKEIKANIDYDIKQDWLEEKSQYINQSIQLACAIGILENLGKNNNISEKKTHTHAKSN